MQLEKEYSDPNAYAINRDEWKSLLKFQRARIDDLEDDIKKNQMYIGKKNGKIAVCFVLNEECDEEYKNGKWICPDSHFCIIHRLCRLAQGAF